MGKINIILFYLFVVLSACAQENLSVKSFKALPNDLSAIDRNTEKRDLNDEVCAIIKVQTTEKGFTFNVGVLGIVATEQKTGEIWVYVPHGIQRITIQHPQLGVLRDYYFDIEIEAARVYELVLHTGKISQIIHQDAGGQYLLLNISPQKVMVKIDDAAEEYVTDGTLQKFLPYGTHSISVFATQYKPYKTNIEIGAERVEKTIKLEEQFGYLSVNANVYEADVYINGENVGKTPYKSDKLKFGNYKLGVVKVDYIAYTKDIDIKEFVNLELNVDLVHNVGNVNISCKSTDAEIYINNERKSFGTWIGKLVEGTYVLEARKDGHRKQMKTITVKRGITETVSLDAPTPMYGKINVSTKEAGVKLYVGDEYLGTTPNIFNDILVGNRRLIFKSEGYIDKEVFVEVKEGDITDVKDISLEKNKPMEYKSNSNDNYYYSNSSFDSSSDNTSTKNSNSSGIDLKTLGEVYYAPIAGIGLRLGYCKKFGIYASCGVLFEDADITADMSCRVTAGAMFRLSNRWYLSAGLGYGNYDSLSKTTEDYESDYTSILAPCFDGYSAFEMEAGIIYRYSIYSLSVGYYTNTHYLETGGPIGIYGNLMFGVGIIL